MRTFGWSEFWFIVEAARWTLALSAIAFVGGGILGLGVALARTGDIVWLRNISLAFIKLFQGTPLLLQLFLIFFGAPVFGVEIDPWIAAGAALTLNSAAFLGEIWRGCIEAVPHGQTEAAQALSLTWSQRMRDVVLPQARRIAIAPTVGYLVQIVKGTSLAAIIGFTEITRAGQIVNNATFQPMAVFSVVAALYFVMCWPLSRFAARLERRQAAAWAR
ncbi:amino acid ABC transporter permease [Pandoraea nosoerga]|uniref:Amino acid ABC transporter permease n=1 Tax=Pandoraea nosoerga TaxID=2508296 RepID=A0A5E4VZL8_9BURK|nr:MULTISPECIES: amino acid ABC transporter permease [Pandoraea]MBN4666209.1 amino acid ABC transporter permease [Pandoraea nosoerga]MBN4676264.1 amino acid ABC transporter permease [Pandoraea nosoerga]MBN4681301.1 amino acid ABC transporter permease [Pandoraea nosoerga]MBN4745376.1 amino acid ABC transporter permease [Pandoraea nosoerga]VVE16744.1 amino acid ABC transporter permease [Pandoraea nosoerga]